jgi:hypothetical protein
VIEVVRYGSDWSNALAQLGLAQEIHANRLIADVRSAGPSTSGAINDRAQLARSAVLRSGLFLLAGKLLVVRRSLLDIERQAQIAALLRLAGPVRRML